MKPRAIKPASSGVSFPVEADAEDSPTGHLANGTSGVSEVQPHIKPVRMTERKSCLIGYWVLS